MRNSSKDRSLNPAFPWALTAVIGQMAQTFVIGLPRVRNQTLIIITEWLETCQYIEKIVSYQFEPESDDETIEVADQQDQDVSQWWGSSLWCYKMR